MKPDESSVGVLTPDCWSNIETALEQSNPSYAVPATN
jgi:hypothetical protein